MDSNMSKMELEWLVEEVGNKSKYHASYIHPKFPQCFKKFIALSPTCSRVQKSES